MNNYKGTYDGNTLTHYRTLGSKNGRTKYPGKYNPIGELAKGPEFYSRMATQQRQAMSSVNNSMEAYRRAQLANRAAISTAAGPQTMARAEANKSYANAQAKAMQDRNKAYGTAYGSMRTYGNAQAKANAARRQVAINSAKNVGTNPSHPTAQPNKGKYGTPSQQQLAERRKIDGSKIGTKKDPELAMKNKQRHAEERRIAGGNAGTSFTQQKFVEQRKASGSKMKRSPEQNRMDAERRRIAGGSAGTITRAEANRMAAEERRAGGFSKTTDAAQSRKTSYQALVNRRAAEQRRTGVISNQAAAEARRIAGGNAGTSKRFSDSKYGKMARSAYNAGKEVAKDAGTLVKKGKKKVKKLLKKWF